MTQIQVAVVYHSGYGHTAKVAEAVAEGAASLGNVKSVLVSVDQIDQYWDTLNGVDAIIFGSPTYMGTVSAPFKTFMDASSKAWHERRWADKVAAGFTNSASHSGDKVNTLQSLALFTAQHGMIWVGQNVLPGNNSSTTTEESLNRHGFFLGLGTQANADQGPDVAPPKQDLETAKQFGARVAKVTTELTAGRKALAG
jgi:multimeric flavodoxin WrbA